MSRKNHKMVDGRLLQIDKRYSNLKQSQKGKINLWITEEIRTFYKEQGALPRKPEQFQLVLDQLYQRIEAIGIWIPYGEIHKRYFGNRNGRIDKVYGQIQKEERSRSKEQILIEPLPYSFAVCKVADYSLVDPSAEFCFPQKTNEENSLVCLSDQVPSNTTAFQNGWRGFRIKGQMDFSLIGILTGIAKVLAGKAISIFALSTFNTDYILVQEADFDKAIEALRNAGYSMLPASEEQSRRRCRKPPLSHRQKGRDTYGMDRRKESLLLGKSEE